MASLDDSNPPLSLVMRFAKVLDVALSRDEIWIAELLVGLIFDLADFIHANERV